jgi:hypothetical protein
MNVTDQKVKPAIKRKVCIHLSDPVLGWSQSEEVKCKLQLCH